MLRVSEECFGGKISDRLKIRGPEQPAQRAASALVIINDRDINILGSVHLGFMSIMGRWEFAEQSPFRDGGEEDLFPRHFFGRTSCCGNNMCVAEQWNE